MLIPLGFIIVTLSVFGGFSMAGGHLGPLYQPTEILMIVGAAVGSFVAANNGKAIKATLRTASTLKRTKKYDKEIYMQLMSLQYNLLSKMRREGVLGVEKDIENPAESALFSEYPRIANDPMIMGFITDYLRLMISGSVDPMELDELMSHEIEAFEHEAHIPADALAKVGDGLPAFGIVAAVLGVVKALASADASAFTTPSTAATIPKAGRPSPTLARASAGMWASCSNASISWLISSSSSIGSTLPLIISRR